MVRTRNVPPTTLGKADVDVGDLRQWPQLLRASPRFAAAQGHEGLCKLVDLAKSHLTRPFAHVTLDTRLSMLMPGMWPCIPGWHCDDFWRPSDGGQPDLISAPYSEHIAIVLGGCSLTRFINERAELKIPTVWDLQVGETLYGYMHPRIEQMGLKTMQLTPEQLVRYSQLTWHCGEAAVERGWRYLFRLTGSDYLHPLNERRTQTQVYLTEPFVGW